MKDVNIFIDLDGVLAGFDEAMLTHFGVGGRDTMLTSAERWELINQREADGHDWFVELPLKIGALEMLEQIRRLHSRVCILSATGNEFFKHRAQKELWCRQQGINKFVDDIIIVPRAECKQFYASGHSILIDDEWHRCVKPFIERGGWGILHTTPEHTMEQLRAILQGHFVCAKSELG